MNQITKIDLSILEYIQNNFKNNILDLLFPKITYLGNLGLIWILILVLFLSSKNCKNQAKLMLISMIFTFIVCNLILKLSINRIRPFNLVGFNNLLIAAPKDSSFPSGHTSFSFCCVGIIFLTIKNKYIRIISLIIAILISLSRLYLYVHYPTDVLCGMIIGLFIAFITYKIFGKKYKIIV